VPPKRKKKKNPAMKDNRANRMKEPKCLWPCSLQLALFLSMPHPDFFHVREKGVSMCARIVISGLYYHQQFSLVLQVLIYLGRVSEGSTSQTVSIMDECIKKM
jgi:hypothetical protein